MLLLRSFKLISATALILLVTPVAAMSADRDLLNSLKPADKAAIENLFRMFQARDAVKDSEISYTSRTMLLGETGQAAPYTLKVVGNLERPNKLHLRVYHGDVWLWEVDSDGVTETIFSVPSKTFCSFKAQQSYDIPDTIADLKEKIKQAERETKSGATVPDLSKEQIQQNPLDAPSAVFGNDFSLHFADLEEAIAGAAFLIRANSAGENEALGESIYKARISTKSSEIPSSDHSMTSVDIVQSMGDAMGIKDVTGTTSTVHYAYDAKTLLPLQYSECVTSGKASSPATPDYRFVIFRPMPSISSDVFTWKPTPGAKEGKPAPAMDIPHL